MPDIGLLQGAPPRRRAPTPVVPPSEPAAEPAPPSAGPAEAIAAKFEAPVDAAIKVFDEAISTGAGAQALLHAGRAASNHLLVLKSEQWLGHGRMRLRRSQGRSAAVPGSSRRDHSAAVTAFTSR